jgi:hypothetical protein
MDHSPGIFIHGFYYCGFFGLRNNNQMENTVKWQEFLKWLTFIGLIVSVFLVSQNQINNLKKESVRQSNEIRIMQDKQAEQGEAVANMNGKLCRIQSDITIIKNAVIVIKK